MCVLICYILIICEIKREALHSRS